MQPSHRVLALPLLSAVGLCAAALGAAFFLGACGASGKSTASFDPTDAPEAGSTTPPPETFSEAGAGGCTGIRCNVPKCAAGTTTAIEGDVYDPAGKTKLYNVAAYVPNAPLAPLANGVTCERCGSVSGDPISAALSDENGHFRLENVPAGKDVPVVIQVGKFRRTITLPKVEACVTNNVPDKDAHLPRNSQEGDLPKMAVVTGGFDELGCLLSRIGIDGAEYTAPTGTGAIHVYRGVGGGDLVSGGAPEAPALWDDATTLEKYDVVLLACEGWEYDEDDTTGQGNKTVSDKQAMHDYATKGGRIFATHYHYTWFKKSPQQDFRDVATWNAPASAYGHTSYDVDTSFPKGAAFAKWLVQAGGSTVPGKLEVDNPAANIAAVNDKTAQRWLYTDSPANVGYMTFNVPVGAPADQQCGRAVFSDVHVSGEEGSVPLPGSCGAAKLTPQELALEFMLFDLTSCVLPDSTAPSAPTVK
jgi:hypothetical protein